MRAEYDFNENRAGFRSLLERRWERFYPGSGSWILDLLAILLLANVQSSLIGQVTGDSMLINFAGAWLMASAITRPLSVILTLSVVTGLVLETYQTAPAGSYICAFWVATSTLYLVRRNLSWHHATTWICTCMAAETWLVLFRSFALWLDDGATFVSTEYVIRQAGEICFAAILGLMLFRLAARGGPIEAQP